MVATDPIKSGKPLGRDVRDLVGKRFGKLVVTSFAGRTAKGKIVWNCSCDCGGELATAADYLANGKTASCGCVKRSFIANHNRTHGRSRTQEYAIWRKMIRRCTVEKSPGFSDYGGRGITVCKRWRESFANFYADMGPRPTPSHSIDRINNDGNYEPANCRWATPQEQGSNKRNNRLITHNGETHIVAEWARLLGVDHRTILSRINRLGWSPDRAVAVGNRRNRLVEFNGVSLTVKQWAERLGIKPHTLQMRLTKCGWSVERALTTPTQ